MLADRLSARELGRLAGVSPTYPTLIELGLRESIGSQSLVKLARVLGATTDWLADGRGRAPSARAVRDAVNAARESRRAA
jgi:transcriptional regulator with XRE-family HTH domain